MKGVDERAEERKAEEQEHEQENEPQTGIESVLERNMLTVRVHHGSSGMEATGPAARQCLPSIVA